MSSANSRHRQPRIGAPIEARSNPRSKPRHHHSIVVLAAQVTSSFTDATHQTSEDSNMEVICQCGLVSFQTSAPAPLRLYHCHCTECQKQSGSAYGTSAVFPTEGIFPLSEDLKTQLSVFTRPTKEGRTMDCYFCKSCGVRIMHRVREANGQGRDTLIIKGGVLKGLNYKGAGHIYTRSAVVEIPVGVERWETSPEPEGRGM